MVPVWFPHLKLRGGEAGEEEEEEEEEEIGRDVTQDGDNKKRGAAEREREVRFGHVPYDQESVRIIPAEEGCFFGSDGKGWHGPIAEWFPTALGCPWMPPRTPPAPERWTRVTRGGDISLHRAMKGSFPHPVWLNVGRGTHSWDGTIKVKHGLNLPAGPGPLYGKGSRVVGDDGGAKEYGKGVHVVGDDGAEAWGQWELSKDSGGTFLGLQCFGNLTDATDVVMDIRHGPWHVGHCGIRCGGGQPVLGMELCEAQIEQSTIGGISGSVGERARGGILLGGWSNVMVESSSVSHSGDAPESRKGRGRGRGKGEEEGFEEGGEKGKVGEGRGVEGGVEGGRSGGKGGIGVGVMVCQNGHCHVVSCTVR